MKKELKLMFGVVFALSLIVLVCDITVFGVFGFRLLPDYVIILALLETVSAFVLIALINSKYVPKAVLCLFQACVLVVCVVAADFYEYRYTDMDGIKTIEICNGVTMAGPTVSYYYEVDGFVRSCEKYASADYGVLQCEPEMIFTNAPEKVNVFKGN